MSQDTFTSEEQRVQEEISRQVDAFMTWLEEGSANPNGGIPEAQAKQAWNHLARQAQALYAGLDGNCSGTAGSLIVPEHTPDASEGDAPIS